MSNTAVGQVYNRVIEAVVEASRIDFEENGVNSSTLETLREKWQERLSQTGRALFPWDPQPNQTSKAESPANQDSNVPEPSSSGTAQAQAPAPMHSSVPAAPAQTNGNSEVQVKQEQALDNSFLNLPQQNYTSGLGSQYAPQRAAQLLQQQFGSQASGSIGALQAAGMRQQNPNHGQQPRDPNSDVKTESPVTGMVKQEISDSDLGRSQNDGTGDSPTAQWEAVIAHRNAQGDHEVMGTVAVDRIIRRHVEEMGRRLEGGGLMVPLEERYPNRDRSKRKRSTQLKPVQMNVQSSSSDPNGDGVSAGETVAYRARFDGPGDSDSEDDDAINSDLDDPDETADNSIEGMYEGDVILCLYDKVQRVKNKWKCVLKDGVVTVEGRDYVFHKASGEFEW